MSEIESALTAEEWESWNQRGCLLTRTSTVDEAASLDPDDRHAVAALALHGQPFGFTHEDVDLLRGSATEYEGADGFFGTGIRINALADRIQALLPPRET